MSKKINLEEFCKTNIGENGFILEQFDYEKNYPMRPKDFAKSSDKKIWFKFEGCGHSCQQRIADKTKGSKQCPLCLNRGGIGRSLLDEYPDIAASFMQDKNGISASEIPAHSGNSYWFKCERCGRENLFRVSDIVRGHSSCQCANGKISFPQCCIYFYLQKLDEDCELNKKIEGYRFDVFSPKYNLAIEFDGIWHDSDAARKNDVIKDELCGKLNIHLLRIRDIHLKPNENLRSIICTYEYDGELNFLKELPVWLQKFGIDTKGLDIDVKRDLKEIQKFRRLGDNSKSLTDHMPELSRFIDNDDERNGNPELINVASHGIRVWLQDPEYPALSWSLTVHELFQKKEPYTQWIKMCRKMLERYPELADQIYAYGNDLRCNSTFKLMCSCGNEFEKTYTALMDKGKVEFCPECICKFRLKNIGR